MTPGCKGCIWACRRYHHTKACKAKKREFLLTKAPSEELRAAEADAWRKPASSTEPPKSAKPSGSAGEEGAQPEPVDEQPQPQPEMADSDMAAGMHTADAAATRRTRILTKRSDPAVPNEEVPKKMSVDAGSCVRTAGETCKNSCSCFGEPRDVRNDARVRWQLGDVHRVGC